jgi:hypothetical protein
MPGAAHERKHLTNFAQLLQLLKHSQEICDIGPAMQRYGRYRLKSGSHWSVVETLKMSQ